MRTASRFSANEGTAVRHPGCFDDVTLHRILQYGTIAWRAKGAGVEVLLITSRETQRWVVPRGNVIKGLAAHDSAAQEAYEEAGVRGRVEPEAVGIYRYDKKLRLGRVVQAEVHLFPLEVEEELAEWPERHQRQRRWFSPEAAAEAVDQPELKALILAMARRAD
jgi:8-oxo-dGTP pyrophosphatase MutT (NUDIX family)